MTATNHGLFGAALAISLQRYPAIALAIAPFTHFLLDAIPHYSDFSISVKSRKFMKILIFDCTLAVVTTLVVAWFWQEIALLVIATAFLSASPDLMWIYYEYINPSLKKVHALPRFHAWIQWSSTPPGAIVELAWFLFFLPVLILLGM